MNLIGELEYDPHTCFSDWLSITYNNVKVLELMPDNLTFAFAGSGYEYFAEVFFTIQQAGRGTEWFFFCLFVFNDSWPFITYLRGLYFFFQNI